MPPVKGLQIRANDQIVISIYKNICEEFINYRKLITNLINEETIKYFYNCSYTYKYD